jgi:hypothetical protein
MPRRLASRKKRAGSARDRLTVVAAALACVTSALYALAQWLQLVASGWHRLSGGLT